jgi:adenylosuccinate lyase
MDQISEHQRDLTNSASQRFIADYVAGFCQAVSRMCSVIQGLGVDRQRLMYNLRGGSALETEAGRGSGIPGGVLAEPAYILLAESGVSDAHEVIRKITLMAEQKRCSFAEALAEHPDVLERIATQMISLGIINKPQDALDFFTHPELYRGLSVQKARKLATKYRALMDAMDD